MQKIFAARVHVQVFVMSILVILVLVSGLFATMGGTAHASSLPTKPASTIARQVTVGLRLDCTHLSPKARIYVDQHSLCPDNIKYGNCGWSSLFITDNFNGGYPTITLGAASSEGYMVYISWHVKWVNHTTGGQNGYGGSQGFFGSTWSYSSNPYTGVGNVFAVMDSLTVVLVWGGVCYGLQPYDNQWVN